MWSTGFFFVQGFVKKGEVDSKMMSGLLSGVNRAFPYAKCKSYFTVCARTSVCMCAHVCLAL